MLRIKGTKGIPEFKIANSELTCSGGIPGTWVEININSSANGFTNKTPYSGVVQYYDGSGRQGTKEFEPNEFVVVTGYSITVTHIIMKGGRRGHRNVFLMGKGGTKNDEDISLKFGPISRLWFILNKRWKSLLGSKFGGRNIHVGSAWFIRTSNHTTTATSADCRERVMSCFEEVA